MEPILATPTSVYLYYDKTGVLLYVGITSRATSRQREHNSDKEWWAYVDHQKVEHYPHRKAALERERTLIHQFRPPFNTQHNPGHADMRALYIASGLGGNRAMRGGTRRPRLVKRTTRQLHAECGGKVALTLIEHNPQYLFYESDADYSQLVAEVAIPSGVLLVAPKKVGTFDHRYASEDSVCLAFRRAASIAPPRATLLIKTRQPYSLYVHQAVAA